MGAALPLERRSFHVYLSAACSAKLCSRFLASAVTPAPLSRYQSTGSSGAIASARSICRPLWHFTWTRPVHKRKGASAVPWHTAPLDSARAGTIVITLRRYPHLYLPRPSPFRSGIRGWQRVQRWQVYSSPSFNRGWTITTGGHFKPSQPGLYACYANVKLDRATFSYFRALIVKNGRSLQLHLSSRPLLRSRDPLKPRIRPSTLQMTVLFRAARRPSEALCQT